MPREEVEWFVKQSLNDNDRLHTQQCCTYHSVVNVDKLNYPYLNSYEQEQTWTLIRTMSNHNKRYQSSIENIHLTSPPILTIIKPLTSKIDQMNYNNNEKIKNDSFNALLPPLPPTKQSSLLTPRSNRSYMDLKSSQQNISNSIKEISKSKANSMRIMKINGEFIVRI